MKKITVDLNLRKYIREWRKKAKLCQLIEASEIISRFCRENFDDYEEENKWQRLGDLLKKREILLIIKALRVKTTFNIRSSLFQKKYSVKTYKVEKPFIEYSTSTYKQERTEPKIQALTYQENNSTIIIIFNQSKVFHLFIHTRKK